MKATSPKRNPRRWEPTAAVACFACSILSLALGFALTTNWILNEVRHPLLHSVGISLLIIGIPLLILGGHCLDLMEKKNSKPGMSLQTRGNRGPRILHAVGLIALLHLSAGPPKVSAQQTGSVQLSVPNTKIVAASSSR